MDNTPRLKFVEVTKLHPGRGRKDAVASNQSKRRTLSDDVEENRYLIDLDKLEDAPDDLLNEAPSLEAVNARTNMVILFRRPLDDCLMALFMAREGWMSCHARTSRYPPGERISRVSRVFYRWAGRNRLIVLPVIVFVLSGVPDNELFDVARGVELEQRQDGKAVVVLSEDQDAFPRMIAIAMASGTMIKYPLYRCNNPSPRLWKLASPEISDTELLKRFDERAL